MLKAVTSDASNKSWESFFFCWLTLEHSVTVSSGNGASHAVLRTTGLLDDFSWESRSRTAASVLLMYHRQQANRDKTAQRQKI